MQNNPAVALNNDRIFQERKSVTDLKIITGGKDGNAGPWLMDLEPGTVFLARSKVPSQDFALPEFHLIFKTERNAKLLSNTNGTMIVWVDPGRFCSKFDLGEILGKYDINTVEDSGEEKEEEVSDGDADRTNQQD